MYNVSVTVFNTNNEYTIGQQMFKFATLKNDFQPGQVVNITVSNITQHPIKSSIYEADFTFNPAEGKKKLIPRWRRLVI